MKAKNYNLKLKTLFKKTKSFTLYVLVFSSTLYTLHFGVNSIYSQSLSLSLWPPLLEVMIQPGRTVTQVYKLTNNSDHELQITPQIFPFKPQGENGEIKINPKPVPSESRDSKSDFFSFESGEKLNQALYLPIGQTREVILKISIPKSAKESDYYYTMLFSSNSPAKKDNLTSSSSVTGIGTNILLTTSQTGKPMLLGRILEFSAPKIVDSFSPVSFTVRLENWGKTFWKPFGQITIRGIFNQKNKIDLYEQNILAESSRRLDAPTIKPKFPLGPFKATLEFSLGKDGQKLSTETIFWFLPYKALAAIVVLLLIGFLIRRITSVNLRAKSVEL